MAPSTEATCSEWIWEYVLTHCSDEALLRSLVQTYPVPDTSLRLKKMLLLKCLSFKIAEEQLAERVIEIVLCVLNLNKLLGVTDEFPCDFYNQQTLVSLKNSITLEDLLFILKVEITIQHLRTETDNWPKFHETLREYWEDPKDINYEESSTYLCRTSKLRKEFRDVWESPCLRTQLVERFRKPFAKKMLECYLDYAWRVLGPTFLDRVADSMSKGLYVPSRSAERQDGFTNRETDFEVASAQGVPELSKKNMRGALKGKHHDKHKGGKSKKILKSKAIISDLGEVNAGGMHSREANVEAEQSKLPEPDAQPCNFANEMEKSYQFQKENVDLRMPEVSALNGEMETTVHNVQGEVCDTERDAENEFPLESLEKLASLPQDQQSPFKPPPWAGSSVFNSPGKKKKLDIFNFSENDVSVCPRVTLPIQEIQPPSQEDQTAFDTPHIQKAQSQLREGQARLSAAVKDPLPEALKIAEEITGEVSNLGNMNGETLRTSLPARPSTSRVLRSSVNAQTDKDKQSRSLMDRNPTAQTFKWDTSDDIADDSDDQSPSSSRQIHLLKRRTRQRFSKEPSLFERNKPRRRKFRRWTEEEENILKKEVALYGKGHWKHILQKHSDVFENRTEVDLKDKWRNIEKRDGTV